MVTVSELARLMLVCGGSTGLVGVSVVSRRVVEDSVISVIPGVVDAEVDPDVEPVASVPDGPVESPPEAVGESGPPDPDVPVVGTVDEAVVRAEIVCGATPSDFEQAAVPSARIVAARTNPAVRTCRDRHPAAGRPSGTRGAVGAVVPVIGTPVGWRSAGRL
jgi:hypothetical protein